ncbi:MAG TPA: glycosyltransferase family 87 protein [Bryobacteraceae bacterium]|nr:glycosyltransferase family 87 protein [Bryobacteraceae bacterium]
MLEVILGIFFLCALEIPYHNIALLGHNDFSTFYAGAKLARTPALYNHEIVRQTVRAGWPDSPQQEVYLRAPFYAVLLKPLAAFPYRTALLIFLCLTVGSFLWFVIRFSKECPDLTILAAFSVPMFLNINGGCDVPLLLPLVGAFVLLSRRGRDFAAGFVLAFCAIKFHLFVFVPFLLLFKKKWRMLSGATAGTLLLTLVGGISLIGPWFNVMFSPLITGMPVWRLCPAPNIHGLVTVLGGSPKIEFLLAGLVILFFVWICFRETNFELLLAVSLICGLLVSFHNFTYDDLLLMPVLVLVSPIRVLRNVVGLALTPVVYLATFAGGSFSTILPVMLLAFLGAVWFVHRRPRLNWHTSILGPAATVRIREEIKSTGRLRPRFGKNVACLENVTEPRPEGDGALAIFHGFQAASED